MKRARRHSLIVLVVASALLAAPALAHAGAVTYSSSNVLYYTAAAGEVNRLSIGVDTGSNRIVYTEAGPGVTITTAEGDCNGSGTTTVSCKIDHDPMAPVFSAGANLGDMDDTATAAYPAGTTLGAGFVGGAGDDQLDISMASTGDLEGDAGVDTLTAARVRTSLVGGPDNDIEIAGPAGSTNEFRMESAADGADDLRGGPGLDTVSYEERTAALAASADGVADDGESGEGDNIAASVESIEGGQAADVLTASNVVDGALSGYTGNDRLVGGSGDDILFGGEGDDALEGNGGDDTAAAGDGGSFLIGGGSTDVGGDSFAGGPGFDTVDYSVRTAPVSVTLNGTADDGEAGEGDNTGADVERFLGGDGADSLSGDGDPEDFSGGHGSDTISPGGGEDFVAAGDGDDSIAAQDGAVDRVSCGVGADTISADFADVLDGCEVATLSPAPIPPDTTAPKITITGLAAKPKFKVLRKGLRFKLGANEASAFVAELQGTAKKATIAKSNNLTLATKSLKLGTGKRSVKLKPPRKLLGARRRLKLRLKVTAKDAAGNTRVATRTIRVRR